MVAIFSKQLFASVLVFASASTQATTTAVYSFVAEDGTPQFSDQPTDVRFLLTSVGSLPLQLRKVSDTVPTSSKQKYRFESEISEAAALNGIDAALIHAMVRTESGYNPNAVSPKGAQGLMQLMPFVSRRYGVTDPFDASQNIRGGAHHLRDLLNQFPQSIELALAAYNAGAGSVISHGRKVPPFLETSRYVTTVLSRYDELRRRFPND